MAASKKSWKTYEDASAWAQQEKIASSIDWHSRTKPADIPSAPSEVYKAEWQGWRAFLGLSPCTSSRVELILRCVLQRVLNLDPARLTRINDGGRPMHVDMADRGRRLVIEYDGAPWHKDAARDHRKTQRLNDAGWTVIRVREVPLALLDPVWDVQVGHATTTHGPMICTVLKHLQALVERGTLSDEGLGAKVAAVLQIPIDETEFHGITSQGWVSYEEASAWAQAQKIKTRNEWSARAKLDGFPDRIPATPRRTYKAQWQGWGAFLGTGNVSTHNKPFRSYADASAWAHQEKIRSRSDWKARTKPADIPADPETFYKSEWQGLGAFLGTGTVAPQNRRYRSCADASAWAQQEKITSSIDWKTRTKPADIPANPGHVYKAEWQGWRAFLGTGRKCGGQPQTMQPVRYVINLTKANDTPAQNDVSFDPAFVMPLAA